MTSKYKLLPVTQAQAAKPQIFNIKFNNDFQQNLIKSSPIPRLKLIVRNGELSIQINDHLTYRLQNLPESAKIDIYKKFSSSTYKNIGSIRSKLIATSPVSSPNPQQPVAETSSIKPSDASNSKNKNTTQSKTTAAKPKQKASLIKRIINYLAYGPVSSKDLASRFKIGEDEAKTILLKIGMPYDPDHQKIKKYPITRKIDDSNGEHSKYFVLNYTSYKDLDLFEKKFTEEEFKILKNNSIIAFDHLGYPSNHPSREALNTRSPKSPTLPDSATNTVKSASTISSSEGNKHTAKHNNVNGLKLPTGPKSTVNSNNRTSNNVTDRKSEIKSSSQNIKPQNLEMKLKSTKLSSEGPLPSTATTHKKREGTPTSSATATPTPSSIPQNPQSSSSATTPSTLNKVKTPKLGTTTTTTSNNNNKRKLPDDKDYYIDLAQRFKSKYKEYESLYKSLLITKQKDTEDVKKLYQLHKSLESWKKQLWNSVATEQT